MDELEAKKQELLEKYQKGLCSPEEKELLYYLYNFADSSFDEQIDNDDPAKAEIWESLPFFQEKKQRRRHRIRLLAAAAAILITGCMAYLFIPQSIQPAELAEIKQPVIVPGTQGATLTLASGKKISLNDVENGALIDDAGLRIVKDAEGSLVYEISDHESSNQYNTLSTDNGETYKVILPDGTQVWLNAASSIKYPSSFKAVNHRRVELEGEAYFEVAKDKTRPFIVKAINQEVEVLGTHFNINAYPEERGVRTTLLEGSVKVSSKRKSIVINPGEQTLLSKAHDMKVLQVDANLAIGWKNNEFLFEQQTIEEVMNTISRWYDVSVVYDGDKPGATFGGGISRFENVAKVLGLLEKTREVRFKIEGRTIHVEKYKNEPI